MRNDAQRTNRLAEALIGLGCYASFWSNVGGIGEVMQLLYLGFFLVASFYVLVTGRVVGIPPSGTELALYSVGVLSACVALFSAQEFSGQYSIIFLGTLILASILTRAVPLERLLDIGALTAYACVLTALLAGGRDFYRALSISITSHGLFRYAPLNTHPVLMGLIFGLGSILMARQAILATTIVYRMAMIAGSLLAVIFLIAASARGALLSLSIAAITAVVLDVRFGKGTLLKLTGAFVVAAGVLAFSTGNKVATYLDAILQIHSSQRGLDSGMTGRDVLWARGISTLVSDPVLLFVGGGLRSSEEATIGFLTENSYITILLDSGVVIGGSLIFALFYALVNARRLSRDANMSDASKPMVLLVPLLVFVLVQSFFERQLLAVGNPASLLVLLLFVSLSLRAKRRGDLAHFQAPIPVFSRESDNGGSAVARGK
jgi:exopolysaccharide production protein ExoQ